MALANSLTKKAPYKGLKPASRLQYQLLADVRLPLDTPLLPLPISRTGVRSHSDRVSARFLGRPLGGTGKVPNRVCDR